MPICSYILYPVKGKEPELEGTLRSWEEVQDIYPSEDQSVYILVTESPNKKSEQEVQDRLTNCRTIDCYTITYANNEHDKE